MINRVLIRIKVVQMLYSYLLTKSEFKIEPAPESATRDKRFAYTVYIDTLLMILRMSGHNAGLRQLSPLAGHTIHPALSSSKLVRALRDDDQIKGIIVRKSEQTDEMSDAISPIYFSLIESSAYKNYIKSKNHEMADDVKFWAAVLPTVVLKNEKFVECARRNPDFSISGLEKGVDMAVATLESFSDNRYMLRDASRSLTASLDKAYELYHALLLLPAEITALRDVRIEAARHKFLATAEDLNPNTRMIENPIPAKIAECNDMTEYLKANPFSWDNDLDMIQRLLDRIMESKIYHDYMGAPSTDYQTDCEFWRSIMKNVILPSDDLAEALESRSVYWNDDIEIMGTFVLKTLKRIASSPEAPVSLLPKYKDDEDARFGSELFMNAVSNFDEYRSLVEKFINSTSWDPERLAFMDLVVMVTAIAELLSYPLIPIPVTLNEYIEIANSYSTSRSGQFVNGILYSVINHLREEGRLNKN